jgi:DNA-directed RNA polymerase specialized sigma24 family protein
MGAADDRRGLPGEQVRSLPSGGNEVAATSEVLRALGPELCGFSRGVLKERGDADEVVSVVSERIWRDLPASRRECSPHTRAHRIAQHRIARFRSTRRHHSASRIPISQLTEGIAAITTRARTTHLSTMRRAWLTTFRNELDGEERPLLTLRFARLMAWPGAALSRRRGRAHRRRTTERAGTAVQAPSSRQRAARPARPCRRASARRVTPMLDL